MIPALVFGRQFIPRFPIYLLEIANGIRRDRKLNTFKTHLNRRSEHFLRETAHLSVSHIGK